MTFAERIASQPLAARRLLALVTVLVAGAVLWWLVVQPLVWIATTQSKWRTQARAELAHSRGGADRLPQIRTSLTRLPADPMWSRLYVPQSGMSPSALLQRDLTRMCADAGIAAQTATVRPSATDGVLARYSVRLTISTTADHLRTFFEQVRRSQHYLRVETLHVSAPQAQRSDENPALSVIVDIAGYARDAGKRDGGART